MVSFFRILFRLILPQCNVHGIYNFEASTFNQNGKKYKVFDQHNATTICFTFSNDSLLTIAHCEYPIIGKNHRLVYMYLDKL